MFRAMLVATAILVVTPAVGSADVLRWDIRSTYPYKVYVKFFSQSRNVAWPSYERAWVLADSKFHEFALNCQRGEKICYGAGTDTEQTTWGVGPRGDMGCSDCCRTCGQSPGRTTLTE